MDARQERKYSMELIADKWKYYPECIMNMVQRSMSVQGSTPWNTYYTLHGTGIRKYVGTGKYSLECILQSSVNMHQISFGDAFTRKKYGIWCAMSHL